MMKQWVLEAGNGIDSLAVQEVPIPQCGDYDVLVKFHAVSLNYRDIMIAQGDYHRPTKPKVIPCSDGAGEVISTGRSVTRFHPTQRVTPTYSQTFLAGPPTLFHVRNSLSGELDGVLREYGVFHENGLVEIPANLSFREAATLPCAALTAWNALYGGPRMLKPGDTVVTQGTGGVSLFAVQFARVGGAEVVATTSSAEKAQVLRGLGVKHVIDYKAEPNWGERAKEVSIGGRGADLVVEVGGPNTLAQSGVAVAIDGIVAIVGTRSGKVKREGEGDGVGAHTNFFGTRRIMAGTRLQFEDMNRAVVANDIRPVVDEKVFGFGEVKEAYRYLVEGRHVGKVVIDIV